MKRKIKKIFLELISNTKIFSIKFCSMKLQTAKILPNLQRGLDKGDWTTSNTVLAKTSNGNKSSITKIYSTMTHKYSQETKISTSHPILEKKITVTLNM